MRTAARRDKHFPAFRTAVVVLRDGRRVLIRRAKPSDAKGMIEHANSVGAEEVYIMTEKLEVTLAEERRLIRQAEKRSRLWIVATRGKEIVGVAEISRGRQKKNRHVGELGIAVRKDSRGLGLGTLIIRSMIDWGRAAGIRKIFLSVFASNKRAIRMYRGSGFVQEGRLKDHVILRGKPTDLLIMSRWL